MHTDVGIDIANLEEVLQIKNRMFGKVLDHVHHIESLLHQAFEKGSIIEIMKKFAEEAAKQFLFYLDRPQFSARFLLCMHQSMQVTFVLG
jgi:hypothetical protein